MYPVFVVLFLRLGCQKGLLLEKSCYPKLFDVLEISGFAQKDANML